MRKNKVRLLLSMLMCLCMINMGLMFSYAGGSSGGSGSGYVSSEPPDLLVAKIWKPDENGNYGPAKGRPVTITVTLSFDVDVKKDIGETLSFEMSKSATTHSIESMDPLIGSGITPIHGKNSAPKLKSVKATKVEPIPEPMPEPIPNKPEKIEDETKNIKIAAISFITGQRIIDIDGSGKSKLLNITTIKTESKSGKKYTCQFNTDDLLINYKTGEAKIIELKVYETPKIPTPAPPVNEGNNRHIHQIREEQAPPHDAITRSDVKARLSISEVKIKDYDSRVTIEEGRTFFPPEPQYPPGEPPKVMAAPNVRMLNIDGEPPTPPTDDDVDKYIYRPLNLIKVTITNTYNPPKPPKPPVPPEEPPVPPEEPPAPPEEKVTKPTPPRTGDMDNLGLIFSLLSVSIGATVFAIKKKNS